MPESSRLRTKQHIYRKTNHDQRCRRCVERGLKELVVQDEEDQEDEADNDTYGNQFLLFSPAAQKADPTCDERARQRESQWL